MRNGTIKKALEYARKLTILADQGELSCRDDGCLLLFSVVRDCAYKIREQAQRERDAHRSKGIWGEQKEPIRTKERERGNPNEDHVLSPGS